MVVKEVVRCSCGCDMYKYPEAYLCPKCDSMEIAKLAMSYLRENMKRVEQK